MTCKAFRSNYKMNNFSQVTTDACKALLLILERTRVLFLLLSGSICWRYWSGCLIVTQIK